MTEPAASVPICSTSCDDDCDAVCHESHVAGHKKRHWPYDCPAVDRYDWGSPFVANAVMRLRAERNQAQAQARTDLSMAVEYQAYALIARMRPDERFVWDVRQLLDVDGRGLRDPVETLDAVRVLLVTRDAERKAVAEPS